MYIITIRTNIMNTARIIMMIILFIIHAVFRRTNTTTAIHLATIKCTSVSTHKKNGRKTARHGDGLRPWSQRTGHKYWPWLKSSRQIYCTGRPECMGCVRSEENCTTNVLVSCDIIVIHNILLLKKIMCNLKTIN